MDDRGLEIRMNPFSEMYEANNPYKWMFLIFSIVLTAAVTPIMYLVIQFQNENPYTTLIQQILSSMIGAAILINILVHIPLILLYIVGPFSQQICNLLLSTQTGLTMQLLLLANVLMITRYLFIFVLKNPVAVHHDFWRLFFFIWTFLFAILMQFTFFLLPGNNPVQFYVCSGEIPRNYNKLNNKVNYSFLLLSVFTFLCQPLLRLQIQLYNWTKGSQKSLMKETNETYDILNIRFQFFITLIYMILLTPIFKIWTLNLISFQVFPTYLWMYLQHLLLTQIFQLLSLTVKKIKNSQLYSFVVRNLKEVLRLD
jgi:hypothetical protein